MSRRLIIGGFLLFSATLILGSFFYERSKYDYRLTVCAMFKNEAPWLKEWITYHHQILGVDHFYLYNNDSSDNYQEILKPFLEKGLVDLIDWSSSDEHNRIDGVRDQVWMPYQLGAYNDCIKNRALKIAKWVAMIDIDEFIVPVHGVPAFYQFLKRMEKRRKGTIRFNWKVFGTSNVWALSPTELLIEKLTLRAEDPHPWHQLAKSIHRPEAILFCDVHDSPTLALKYRRASADPSEFCIHHYWTRTEKACLEKRKMTKEESIDFFRDTNRIEDKTMHQYLLGLKRFL